MAAEGAYRFRIAGEDRRHFDVARAITRRRLIAAHGWLDGLLDDASWEFERITEARARVNALFPKRFGAPQHGRFGGSSARPDAQMVRAQLQLWHDEGWPFTGAVVMRDLDGQDERRDGARLAIDEADERGRLMRPVVLGHANPEVEAWIIVGFVPEDDAERDQLRAEIQRLGFDPREAPTRLTAKRSSDDRDAKRSCLALTGDDPERIDRCFGAMAEGLSTGATRCGLAAFVHELDRILVPEVVAPLAR